MYILIAAGAIAFKPNVVLCVRMPTAATQTIRAVIDMREDDLWAQLEPYHTLVEKEGWYATKAQLGVGDIALYLENADGTLPANPLMILERKTAEDLGASQKDGRYREQRARLYAMRGNGTAIAYIIETPPWSANLSRTWCRGAFNEVKLQQAIARLQFRHTIPVFMAANIKETIAWIRRFAKTLLADPSAYTSGLATTACEAAQAYTDSIHVKKAENNSPDRIYRSFLLAIPGLGKASVDAIATATEHSFTKLLALSEKELAELKGGKRKVGKAAAAAIYAAVHS